MSRRLRGGTRQLAFAVHAEGGDVLAPGEVTLHHVLRAVLDDRGLPDTRFSDQVVLPVTFRCTDAFGNEFETTCEIRWDLTLETGNVVHRSARAVRAAARP